MQIPICHCSRCHSVNTIRVHEEALREHWYCYDCGRGFEVPIEESEERVQQVPVRAFTRLPRSYYN